MIRASKGQRLPAGCHNNNVDCSLPAAGGRSRGSRGGTGQIRGKVKEDESGIGIADARSLSSEAGDGAG